MHRLGSQGLSVAYPAVLCFPLALPRGATPSRDIAFQSRRPANLGGALPSPCRASLCLRLALLLKATPSLPVSVHRRCMPRLCFAVAPRRTALRHRSCSLPVLADLPNASARRFVAGPSRSRSFRCSSFASRFQAVLGCAVAMPGFTMLLLRQSPPMLCRRLRAALPCSSLATLDIAMPILRRSRLSRAFPSPHRANQSVSFAESRNAFPSQLSA